MQLSLPPYLRSRSYQPVGLVTFSPFVERHTYRSSDFCKRDREEKVVDGRKRILARPRRRCGIIFTWVYKKSGRKTCTEFLWFRRGKEVGCHEHGNETSGSKNDGCFD